MSPAQHPSRALKERAIQNTVADLGYPAPRVLAACSDRATLGGGFLLMERAVGRPLLEDRPLSAGRRLADAQLQLHALDPEPLLRALDAEGCAAGGGVDRRAVAFDAHLVSLERRIGGGPLTGLEAGKRWFLDRCPPRGPHVICHGDFHPQNLLAMAGRVTAVLDWANVLVAEPECDVASTLAILHAAPVELLPVHTALRPLLAGLRSILVARYLARYRRARRLDAGRLAYYEAAACMRALVRAGEARLAGSSNPLDTSSFGDRLAARFARATGVSVSLPPPRG